MMSSIALLVAFCSISAFFFTSHFVSQQPKLRWIPESAIIILFGLLTILATGLVAQTGYISTFNTELFFKILLPPIIFASGFKVDLGIFYQNISTILVFANIGTIINTLVFGAAIFAVGKWNLSTGLTLTESMSFGSVISATDPVTTIAIFDHLQVEPALYVIVVGVSILDDAVSIIMFELFNSIMSEGSKHSVSYYLATSTAQFLAIFGGSVAVGCAVGLLFAAAMKRCQGILSNPVQFHMLTLCAVYISYLVADSMNLSGITTVMFSGMAMQRYLRLFAAEEALVAVTHAVSLAAQLFETVSFFMIGYSLLQNTPSSGQADGVFVLWSLLLTLLSRAAQIYPLAWALNAYNKPLSSEVVKSKDAQTLSWGYQHVMMVAGLRGPIAYATSKLFPDTFGHNNVVAVATSVVLVATIVVLGPLTVPTLHTCKVPFGQSDKENADYGDSLNGDSLGDLEMATASSQHEGFRQVAVSSRSDHDTVEFATDISETPERSFSNVVCSVMHCTSVVQWMERVERTYAVDYFTTPDAFAPVSGEEDQQKTSAIVTAVKNTINKCRYCVGGKPSPSVRPTRHFAASPSEYSVKDTTNNILVEQDEFETGSVFYSHFNRPNKKLSGGGHSPTIAVKGSAAHSSPKSVSNTPSDRAAKRRREQADDFQRLIDIVQEGIDIGATV